MRIATWNIWNSDAGMPSRAMQLQLEITNINADIICLQEVKNLAILKKLNEKSKYPYSVFLNHPNEEEGQSVLSRYPLSDAQYLNGSMLATANTPYGRIAFVNVHLSWESALQREKQIIEAEKTISQIKADYRLILGDFNCSSFSNVHQFLLGQASLRGNEAKPVWYDLAESYACKTNITPDITLDFQNNPRWQGQNILDTNQRFDRILLQNPYPCNPPMIIECKSFGKNISPMSGLTPSDHYGIYVDLKFKKQSIQRESSQTPSQGCAHNGVMIAKKRNI